MSIPCPPSVPVPPAGVLTITDVTHSTMRLNWDAAPGAIRKYMITYKPEEGELKEVRLRFCLKDTAWAIAPFNYRLKMHQITGFVAVHFSLRKSYEQITDEKNTKMKYSKY